MKRVVLGLLCMVVTVGAFATWKGESADKARVEMTEARKAHCKLLTDDDVKALHKALGKEYTFIVVAVDNRKGSYAFEYKPYGHRTIAATKKQVSHESVRLKYEVMDADVSEATKSMFGDQVIPAGEQGLFCIAFEPECQGNTIGALEVYYLINEYVVRCD